LFNNRAHDRLVARRSPAIGPATHLTNAAASATNAARGDRAARGTTMVKPPKIPANVGRLSRTDIIIGGAIALGVIALLATQWMPALSTGVREAVQPSEPLSPANAGEICLRLTEKPDGLYQR